MTRWELIETLVQISPRLGDKRRIAIYFINKDVLNEVNPAAIPIIEFKSTTLVEVKKRGSAYTFEVLKSVTPEIDWMASNYEWTKLSDVHTRAVHNFQVDGYVQTFPKKQRSFLQFSNNSGD